MLEQPEMEYTGIYGIKIPVMLIPRNTANRRGTEEPDQPDRAERPSNSDIPGQRMFDFKGNIMVAGVAGNETNESPTNEPPVKKAQPTEEMLRVTRSTLPAGYVAQQSDAQEALEELPPLSTLSVGQILRRGREKWGKDNWRGISVPCHVGRAMRHLLLWLAGDRSEAHLTNAICRLLFASELTITAAAIDGKLPRNFKFQ